MAFLESQFLLAIGNPDTREHLKAELALRFPLARFAFSEGRLTSFKHGPATTALWSTRRFPEIYTAETTGIFIGKTADASAPPPGAGDVPEGFVLRPLALAAATWWGYFPETDAPPELNDREYGLDRPGADRLPSRAYFKLVEMAERSGVPIVPGSRVVEIGCAPGGMSLFALEAGADVIGVDRGVVSQTVRGNRKFKQMHHSVGELRPAAPGDSGALPDSFDHLVVDMHASPAVLLQECDYLFGRVRKSALLTLKLNEPLTVRELPAVIERLRTARPWRRTWVGQLPSHHREICFIGTL